MRLARAGDGKRPLREGLRPGCAAPPRAGRCGGITSACRSGGSAGRRTDPVELRPPLPAAFSATLGRFVPLRGPEGVALLLTMVVELISCSCLAGLSALRHGFPGRAAAKHSPFLGNLKWEGGSAPLEQKGLTAPSGTLPKPSLTSRAPRRLRRYNKKSNDHPSNVLPIWPRLSLAAVLPNSLVPEVGPLEGKTDSSSNGAAFGIGFKFRRECQSGLLESGPRAKAGVAAKGSRHFRRQGSLPN